MMMRGKRLKRGVLGRQKKNDARPFLLSAPFSKVFECCIRTMWVRKWHEKRRMLPVWPVVVCSDRERETTSKGFPRLVKEEDQECPHLKGYGGYENMNEPRRKILPFQSKYCR